MGNFFEISEESRAYAMGVFDDMLNDWAGKPCKLIYESTETSCPNCIIDPKTKESTNRYKTGGPIPFPKGEICPVCEGRGRIQGTATSDLIIMSIDWTAKTWVNMGQPVKLPAGTVMTRGFYTDLPKVLRADYVFLDINNNYLNSQYKLWGEPYIPGFTVKNRYFIAYWQRVGI